MINTSNVKKYFKKLNLKPNKAQELMLQGIKLWQQRNLFEGHEFLFEKRIAGRELQINFGRRSGKSVLTKAIIDGDPKTKIIVVSYSYDSARHLGYPQSKTITPQSFNKLRGLNLKDTTVIIDCDSEYLGKFTFGDKKKDKITFLQVIRNLNPEQIIIFG